MARAKRCREEVYFQVIIIRNIFIGPHEFALPTFLLRRVRSDPEVAGQQLSRQA